MKDLSLLLGEKIRRLREDQGYSQEEFAEKAGIHRTYLGVIERGEKNMTIMVAKKIADALGLSLNELFEEW